GPDVLQSDAFHIKAEQGPPTQLHALSSGRRGEAFAWFFNGRKDSRGYAVWDNIHGVFAHCAGAKTSDGSKFKNATTAGVEHIDKECLCSDASASPATDIKAGCTGKVVSGDLVLKDWENPPLHLVCAKRVWQKTVEEILEAKKQYKDLGTTADKEASQPSASVPSDSKTFK
ncbi:unnamed protein product, partial [Ascophyllum nodosum]